jgi:mono/diheme cytochrome c family protein
MSHGTGIRRFGVTLVLVMLTGGLVGVWAEDAAPPWTAPARAARKKNPVDADAASVAAGQALYEKNCLSCHGATGKGNGPAAKDLQKTPGDLSQAKMWEQTDGALFWKLTEGRTPMPTFEKTLSETERWQTINYIRTLAPKPASTSTQPANDGGK